MTVTCSFENRNYNHCVLPWGHPGDCSNDDGPFTVSGSGAEHARRQQAVADAAKLEELRAWAKRVLFVRSPTTYSRGFEAALLCLLERLNGGGAAAEETAPSPPGAQPPTEPSPSSPARLAEAFAMVEALMRRMHVGEVRLLSDAGGLQTAHACFGGEGSGGHGPDMLTACRRLAEKFVANNEPQIRASGQRLDNTRAVLAELTEGT